MALEFIKPAKGNDLLLHEGYIFSRRKQLTSGETVCECTKRRKENACNATVKTMNGAVTVAMHNPDKEEINALKARAAMKRKAKDSAEPTQSILNSSIEGLPQETLVKIGKTESVKRDIRRQRTQNEPDVPRNNDYQFAIPESYTLTMNGNEFLKYDNDVRRRMLIFGTTQSLHYLSNAAHWIADGTFGVVPAQFAQRRKEYRWVIWPLT